MRELDVGWRGSRRRRVGHMPGIDLVESREIIDIFVVDRHLDQVGHRRPGGLEDGGEVLERLFGLGLDPVARGTCRGVDSRGP